MKRLTLNKLSNLMLRKRRKAQKGPYAAGSPPYEMRNFGKKPIWT